MALRQLECADILGVAQAASAVAPETEFPSQPDIQLPLEQDERVEQRPWPYSDRVGISSHHKSSRSCVLPVSAASF
jgi:hypothetical protein